MTPSAKEWWYTRQSQRFGPLIWSDLCALANSGSLLAEDMVWKEGMATWLPAAQIQGLFPDQAITQNPPDADTLNACITGFVGPQYRFYGTCWGQMQRDNSKLSWNWAAFLFAPLWLVYRKMYAFCAAYFGVALFLGVLGSALGFSGFLSFPMTIGFGIAAGLYGNYGYLWHVNKSVRAIIAKADSPDQAYRNATKQGGTSVAACILGLMALSFLVAMFG